MSAYREAPPARPLESAWTRWVRRAGRVVRWPLEHVRMWHVFAALALTALCVLLGYAWREVLIILGMALGVFAALAVLSIVFVFVADNWKRPIRDWRLE